MTRKTQRKRPMMKAATFNANSVRARMPILIDWIEANSPDILCIQETKAQDKDFPEAEFSGLGYYVVFRGQKSYNGVAIASKEKPQDVSFGLDDGGEPDEARLIRATVAGIPVVNTYVPQGRSLDSPFFQYKLEWFRRLRAYFDRHFSPDKPLLWTGDLNVAPEPKDVYDPQKLAGSVCFHPDEHKALEEVKEWGFVDVFRKHRPEAGLYSFWDYRMRDALGRNRGWRLDHILATRPLAEKSAGADIDIEPRRAERPSDHTFVTAEFKL